MKNLKMPKGFDMALKAMSIAGFALLFYGCAKPKSPASSTTNVTPVTNTAAAIASGKSIFEQNCVRCHGEDGTNIPAWKGKVGDMSRAKVVDTIKNGNDRMPAFGTKLSSKEVEDVATYAQELAVK